MLVSEMLVARATFFSFFPARTIMVDATGHDVLKAGDTGAIVVVGPSVGDADGGVAVVL